MRKVTWITVAVVLTTTIAYSQAEVDVKEELRERLEKDTKRELTAPTLESVLIDATPAIQIQTSKDSKSATLVFGRNWYTAGQSGEQRRGHSLSVQIAGPIDGNVEVNRLASLDKLADGTTAALKYRFVHFGAAPELGELDALCKSIGIDPAGAAGCDYLQVKKKLGTNDPRLGAFKRAAGVGTVWLGSLALEAGRKRFDFVDAETLEEEGTVRHTDTSVSASLGSYLGRGLFFLGTSYEYQRSHQGGSKQQICADREAGSGVRCQDLTLGGPTNAKSHILTVEARKYLSSQIGLVARVKRDFEDDVTAVQIPVFMLQSKADGGLTGGVDFGWRSDRKDFTVTLFVGAMKDLF